MFFFIGLIMNGFGNYNLRCFAWKKRDPQTFVSWLRLAVSGLNDLSYR